MAPAAPGQGCPWSLCLPQNTDRPVTTRLSLRTTRLSPRSTRLSPRTTRLSLCSKAWESQLLSPHTASTEACALHEKNKCMRMRRPGRVVRNLGRLPGGSEGTEAVPKADIFQFQTSLTFTRASPHQSRLQPGSHLETAFPFLRLMSRKAK